MKLTHVKPSGEARMVDVGKKPVVRREATATGKIFLQPETLALVEKNRIQKGDVLSVARIAAIQAAKRTSDLIPLCHNIPLDQVNVEFTLQPDGVEITARAACHAKTGIEMEVLTAVATAALTIYDMCKAVDKHMIISEITLKEKIKK